MATLSSGKNWPGWPRQSAEQVLFFVWRLPHWRIRSLFSPAISCCALAWRSCPRTPNCSSRFKETWWLADDWPMIDRLYLIEKIPYSWAWAAFLPLSRLANQMSEFFLTHKVKEIKFSSSKTVSSGHKCFGIQLCGSSRTVWWAGALLRSLCGRPLCIYFRST